MLEFFIKDKKICHIFLSVCLTFNNNGFYISFFLLVLMLMSFDFADEPFLPDRNFKKMKPVIEND
jgi:hypothetical protein